MDDVTQFSIKTKTKDRLDKIKVANKEEIIKKYKKKKRYVTNDDAIQYLIDTNPKVKG